MSRLKPCPFCGGEAELYEYDNQFSEVVYIISCFKCNCKMELNHEGRLVDKWSTRAQNQWISVVDDFPKSYEEVYIWPRPDYGYECFTGIYDKNYQCWIAKSHNDYGSERHKVNVTHWANLPLTPKEQGQ